MMSFDAIWQEAPTLFVYVLRDGVEIRIPIADRLETDLPVS
jgi:hypothetical protein